MLKSLKTIKKINKNELDKEGAKLGSLKKELFQIQELKKQYEYKLKTEAKILGDETLIYLNDFVLQMRKDINNLSELINIKEKEVIAQESIVTEKFIELKKIEILEKNKIEEMRESEKYREQKELDEVGQIIWNRNKTHF